MNVTLTRLIHSAIAPVLVAFGFNASAEADLVITQNADTAAGRAAFGPANAAFDWSRLFAAGTTWTVGSLGPSVNGPSGFPVGPAGAWAMAADGSTFHVANWIDGDGHRAVGYGFNAANGSATPDLAVNGAESFTLEFANAVQSVGLTISTGLSNLPTEVNHAGATFQLSTDTGAHGTLTLPDDDSGYSAWLTIRSSTPFSTLTFVEPSGDFYDQYFGNVYAPVPEPGAGWMLLTGLMGIGALWRRRLYRCA